MTSIGEAIAGIEAVLAGELQTFRFDYEISTASATRWYHAQVVPLSAAEGAVITHSDISDRKRIEEALGHQATHDPLTGMVNRDFLVSQLDQEVAAARRAGTSVAVVYADLDNFKDVNDAFGHQYGDLIITTVAQRLAEVHGPEVAVLARVGGDEFVIVYRDLPESWSAETAFRAIRQALDEPIDLGFTAIKISASVGVVTVPPHSGDASAILRDADTAMYVSKRAGRNQWTTFNERIRAQAIARVITNDRVEQALAAGEFELHFQPIIDLRTGLTIGSEALLRWRDPHQGLLAPAAFLPALESGPMIEVVGEWVIDRALQVQQMWQRCPGHTDHQMSVNVSPRQIGRGRLVDAVRTALSRHDVAAANLCLEIVEESLVQTGRAAEQEIQELHELGVHLAVDDFGTGYSSIAYLQRFPIDVLKIDRAFLRSGVGSRIRDVVDAIGALANAVGAVSLAEGIETSEDLALVTSAGIDRGQGFLLGRPAPAGNCPSGGEAVWGATAEV